MHEHATVFCNTTATLKNFILSIKIDFCLSGIDYFEQLPPSLLVFISLFTSYINFTSSIYYSSNSWVLSPKHCLLPFVISYLWWFVCSY